MNDIIYSPNLLGCKNLNKLDMDILLNGEMYKLPDEVYDEKEEGYFEDE